MIILLFIMWKDEKIVRRYCRLIHISISEEMGGHIGLSVPPKQAKKSWKMRFYGKTCSYMTIMNLFCENKEEYFAGKED